MFGSAGSRAGRKYVPPFSIAYWQEQQSVVAPNVTVPVSIWQAIATGFTNIDAVIRPGGAGGGAGTGGALLAHVPDSLAAGGNKRGNKSVDFQMRRAAAANVASGNQCFLGGGQDNTVSGSTNAANVAGSGNLVSGSEGFCGSGVGNTVSGAGAGIVTGNTCTASGSYSYAFGAQSTTRGIDWCSVLASGKLNVIGDSQTGLYSQFCQTAANLTPVVATGNNGGVTATSTIVLPNNSCYTFRSQVAARSTTTDVAGYEIVGVIYRNATAASTVLLGSTVTTLFTLGAAAPTWAVVAQANTANGALEIKCTGSATATAHWTVTTWTTESVGPS